MNPQQVLALRKSMPTTLARSMGNGKMGREYRFVCEQNTYTEHLTRSKGPAQGKHVLEVQYNVRALDVCIK